jgi:hypothetical protein
MSARTFTTILSLAAVPFFACGGDSKTVDAGLVLHDTGSNGSGSNGSAACAVMASYSPTFSTSNSAAFNVGSDFAPFTEHNSFVGLLGATQSDPVLQIDVFGGAGSANGSDWPTDLGPKSGIDIHTVDDAQVTIFAGSDGSIAYLAASGTLNVTAASKTTGQTYSGSISNVQFVHVDIDASGHPTPDPDGCTSTIANASFTGVLKAPPMMLNGKSPVTFHPVLIHRYQ